MARDDISVWIPRVAIDRKGNRKLTFVGLKIKYNAETLFNVANELRKRNISILTGIHSVEVGENIGSWVFVIDYTRTKYSEYDIEKILRKIKGVVDVVIGHRRIGNVISPKFNYKIEVQFEPIIIFTKPTWDLILEGLGERFGKTRDVFLYFMGFEYGRRFTKEWKSMLKLLGNSKAFMKFALESLRAFNWIESYEIEMLDVDLNKVRIHLRNVSINSYLIKGFVEGVIYVTDGKRVTLSEAMCIDHKNCLVFEIRKF